MLSQLQCYAKMLDMHYEYTSRLAAKLLLIGWCESTHSEMGLVQHAAHVQIAGMGRQYGMWVRAAATRANAAMYCRYWVAHPRAVLAGSSQSGALSHMHNNTPATLDSMHMMARRMLG